VGVVDDVVDIDRNAAVGHSGEALGWGRPVMAEN